MTKLYFIEAQLYVLNIDVDAVWLQNGITVTGGNGPVNAISQLHYTWSICIDDDQAVYVSEYSNHRIVKWSCDALHSHIVAGGNKQGAKMNQLNSPANVVIDKKMRP